ncbi:DUF5427 domain-containing protein MTC1 KNAG_0J02600 [Huiozyma naganishii CBS 8797]|uniref:Maintenance of telomere capping protein 1 n=1 Tax=Huiozyma naganishii (strain ATCC MYA-139 / BCRC 22969 / CBS 8797 / KCTC 17520 / NBRC 10181 / NCYC 3082 / Yp74L-3) TaxID=1071383 RepID=J7S9W7_HUIN7|nr:hypothetical protein KNAG_0J02600 [Kazachstania naganishii CBS 8797]CCK72339.1 hypothetical protein KNAG_0J02600 [Kazachstania naganishii CBS 8797]
MAVVEAAEALMSGHGEPEEQREQRVSREAEDVFEFLGSLPQGKAEQGREQEKGEGDGDVFEFLEELEKSNLSVGGKRGGEAGGEKQVTEKGTGKQRLLRRWKGKTQRSLNKNKGAEAAGEQEGEQSPAAPDSASPAGAFSLSNWWSASGSATVSQLWNRTTEQATTLTNKIAQEHLHDLQGSLPIKLDGSTISELARNLQKIVVGETEEVLRIHLVHDFVNVKYLQRHVEQKFDQVLSSQVQGGVRIFVDEWGRPGHRDAEDEDSEEEQERQDESHSASFNVFYGKVADGEKLAFANLDNAVKLFSKAHDEMLRQQRESTDGGSAPAQTPDSISDVFVSLLAIAPPERTDAENEPVKTTDAAVGGNFSFTVVLRDVSNDITTVTRSQGFPLQWLSWLEGSALPMQTGEDPTPGADADDDLDPREWVQGWAEDGLALALGVAAQNYVINRMGF